MEDDLEAEWSQGHVQKSTHTCDVGMWVLLPPSSLLCAVFCACLLNKKY